MPISDDYDCGEATRAGRLDDGLLLHHQGTCSHGGLVSDVADAQANEIASAELAVDPQIEKREISDTLEDLQARSNTPHIPDTKRRLLSDEYSLVPSGPHCR